MTTTPTKLFEKVKRRGTERKCARSVAVKHGTRAADVFSFLAYRRHLEAALVFLAGKAM